DACNAIRRQRTRTHQELRIPPCVDVVGNRSNIVAVAHRLAQKVHQRGLARSNRTANADPKRATGYSHVITIPHHDLNSLVYCVSCRMLAMSARKVAVPRSSRLAAAARLAVAETTVSSAANTRWLSVWPSGMRRLPAEIQLDVSACRKACSVGGSPISCTALRIPTATG